MPPCRAGGRRSIGGGLGSGSLFGGAPTQSGIGRRGGTTAAAGAPPREVPDADHTGGLPIYEDTQFLPSGAADAAARARAPPLDKTDGGATGGLPIYEDTQFLSSEQPPLDGVGRGSSFAMFEDTQFLSRALSPLERPGHFAPTAGCGDDTAPLMMYEDTQFLSLGSPAGGWPLRHSRA